MLCMANPSEVTWSGKVDGSLAWYTLVELLLVYELIKECIL